jgi:hypothetical protein
MARGALLEVEAPTTGTPVLRGLKGWFNLFQSRLQFHAAEYPSSKKLKKEHRGGTSVQFSSDYFKVQSSSVKALKGTKKVKKRDR